MATAKLKVDRLEKAKEILANGEVRPVEGKYAIFKVRDYDVDLNVVVGSNIIESCTCPDHVYRGAVRCKHITAALLWNGVDENTIGKGVVG